jgi:hypothetical protein
MLAALPLDLFPRSGPAGDCLPELPAQRRRHLQGLTGARDYQICDMVVKRRLDSKRKPNLRTPHLQATGKSITYDEVIVMRFADRRVAEVWALVDVFSQMQQLGVIPAQRT